jgi:hypothetical protein
MHMRLISILLAAVADRMRPRRVGWRSDEARTSCGWLVYMQAKALAKNP